MKKLLLFELLGVLAASAEITAVAQFRAPAETAREVVPGFLWLEAEGFADYGAWQVDTQFTHKMGSAYLIAPGVCTPIGKARTIVAFPRGGTWQAWARTKDWIPEHHPGRFRLTVDGQAGETLGASGKPGWRWEKAGSFTVAAGAVEVGLEDLSGAFARCDAILFTENRNYVPPEEGMALEAERARLAGLPAEVAAGGTYDVVVVGAGPGGCGAAIAAARGGARTLLVHDRPVLGGNAGAEYAVGMNGAGCVYSGYRETGIVEESCLLSLKPDEDGQRQSYGYGVLAAREKCLTVVNNVRILSAETKDGVLASILGRDTLTGRRTVWRGRLFIDATGDGWLGYFAGAKMLTGREGRARFGEPQAPEEPDNFTMSGCIMGEGGCSYRIARTDAPVSYETPAWARILPKGFTRNISTLGGHWWLEHGGEIDDVADPELARDMLIRYSFAYWGWVKNESPLKGRARSYALTYVPWRNARREGMRLEGDYIFTANDAMSTRSFPDRITITGWPLDTHDPLGLGNPTGDGFWHPHPVMPAPCDVPYRILYSKNIANLFMCGRCVSASHIALGTLRVQSTCCSTGQAAGTAAAACIRLGLSPREYGEKHIADLQQQLLKDDVFIQALANQDPADLARQAHVSASSTAAATPYDIDGQEINPETAHPLRQPRAMVFDRGVTAELTAFDAYLENTSAQPATVKLCVFETDEAAWTAGAKPIAESTATVPAGQKGFVTFPLSNCRFARRYAWTVLMPAKDVLWRLYKGQVRDVRRAWLEGKLATAKVVNEQYAFRTTPVIAWDTGDRPANVIDGVSRAVGQDSHAWLSDGELPAWIRLDWDKPQTLSQVRLTFDSDLATKHPARPMPPQLVKAYRLEVSPDGTTWQTVAAEGENRVRHRIHDFPATSAKAVRLTVLETYGAEAARVFEIRAYGPDRETAAAELSAKGRTAVVAPFKDGERVVFLGDSITHGGRYVADLQFWWLLRHPDSNVKIFNAGICGQRANHGLERFDWDVAPLKPTRIFILFGMNDVSRDSRWAPPYDAKKLQKQDELLATYVKNMTALVKKCRDYGVSPTIITPTPYDQYSPRPEAKVAAGTDDPGLKRFAAAARELAQKEQLELVEFYDVLAPILKANPDRLFLKDRVHPAQEGHLLMANCVLKAMGLEAPLGDTTFVVSNPAAAHVDFVYQPPCLPYPTVEEYAAMDVFGRFSETWNREIVRVKGLTPGHYALKLGEVDYGRFTADELAEGVDLARVRTNGTAVVLSPTLARANAAYPLLKRFHNAQRGLRVLAQTFAQVKKRGGDITSLKSCLEKYDEWIAEYNSKESTRYYAGYYGKQIPAFKKAFETRAQVERDLREMRDEMSRMRPQAYRISVVPQP